MDALCLMFYVKDDKGATPVRYSGNPGYVVGLPLVSGTRTTEYPSLGRQVDFLRPFTNMRICGGHFQKLVIILYRNDLKNIQTMLDTKSSCILKVCLEFSTLFHADI